MDDQSISRFWENYIEKLEAYQVKPDVARWYVRHAELYTKAYPEQRLATRTLQILEQYLKAKGRNSSLKDWQYQQMVIVLKVLFVGVVKAPWATDFPWQFWIDSSHDLPSTHPTVARDYGASHMADK